MNGNGPDELPFEEGYLIGLLLGDGEIITDEGEERFRLYSTNRKYVNWLTDLFGDFVDWVEESTYRYKYKPTEERRESYEVFSIPHPRLTYYGEFYSSDDPYPVPENIVLSPQALKMWHASDGTLNWPQGARNPTLQLATDTKQPAERKYAELFEELDTELKSSYKAFYFSVRDTQSLIAYMGRAIPGFEYKWEPSSKETYNKVKKYSG